MTVLEEASNCAGKSHYFEQSDVPDAGELALAIVEKAHKARDLASDDEQPMNSFTLATFSASLSSRRLSVMQANRLVRRELRELSKRAPRSSASGIFGKSLWVFSDNQGEWNEWIESLTTSIPIEHFSEVLSPNSHLNLQSLQLMGWLGAVATSLQRRTASPRAKSSLQAASAATRLIKECRWDDEHETAQALRTLKCFTQPTWWVQGTQSPSSSRHDRHFTSLLNEQQYNADIRRCASRDWILAVTDVAGLFLGSTEKQDDLRKIWEGQGPSDTGIAGAIVAAMRDDDSPQELANALFSSRLRSARRLDAALTQVATTAYAHGGATYATHGDGVSVLLPRDTWESWIAHLSDTPPSLPTAVGGVVLEDAKQNIEHAAEVALLMARTKMPNSNISVTSHLGTQEHPAIHSSISRWRRLSSSDDAVERWIGVKALDSMESILSS